jgi:hypothetical protein
MTEPTLSRVLEETSRFYRERSGGVEEEPPFGANSAVCQDALIIGIGVEDYVDGLESEFGPVV